MRSLTDMFEGLLDVDFDVPESTLSIDDNAHRITNDLYTIPRTSTLRSLDKLINPDIPIIPKIASDKYNWITKYPAVQRILSWIATKPMSWFDNNMTGEFYVAFLNQCLTDAGRKKKWKVWLSPIRIIGQNGAIQEFGGKVSVDLLTGSTWTTVARLAVYNK